MKITLTSNDGVIVDALEAFAAIDARKVTRGDAFTVYADCRDNNQVRRVLQTCRAMLGGLQYMATVEV